MNLSKKILMIVILTSTLLVSNSFAGVRCSTVEFFGNLGSRLIDNQMSNYAIDKRIKLNKRKTLVVTDIRSVRFKGCTMNFNLGVVLERKYRRNAKGTIGASATISSFNRSSVCVTNVRVKAISLSHTTRLAEKIYQAVASSIIPNNTCFNL